MYAGVPPEILTRRLEDVDDLGVLLAPTLMFDANRKHAGYGSN
jgi:hypothetical protein